MARPELNEERGARRAAELKRRFRSVSKQTIPDKDSGEGESIAPRGRTDSLSLGKALIIWLVIGTAALVLGTLFS